MVQLFYIMDKKRTVENMVENRQGQMAGWEEQAIEF